MFEFWKQTIELCKDEFSSHVFNTWIKPLEFKGFVDGELCVEVPNNLYRDKVKKFYYPFLLEKVRNLSNEGSLEISFVVSEKKEDKNTFVELPKKNTIAQTTSFESSDFQQNYTFDTFVIGNNNHLACAASEGICSSLGKKYNPLLIYGGVGLGKTHLLHAIGNKVKTHFPGQKVVYKTSEQFMNDLVHSIRFEKMDAFRNKYRQCDVLLIDDIQFFSGKERTQEEFFHTFNVLFGENKQIVLSSDRLPSEIPDLDNRLRSRFQSGLFCDIQSPDLETRLAILKKKAEEEMIPLTDEIAFYMAKHIQSNIRLLEGALIRLSASASLKNVPISQELAIEVVSSMTIAEKKIGFEDILKTVALFYHLTTTELKSSKRKKTISQPRQIAMFLARKHTDLSFPELGQKFGGKDHTTIMHGVGKIQAELTINEGLQNSIAAIEKNLLQR